MSYRLRVHWLKKTLFILLAALWLPAVSHCDLEHLPGFAFLACCELPTEASEHNNDCQTDNCGTVESGLYKLEEHSDAAPAPILILDVAVLARLAGFPLMGDPDVRPGHICNYPLAASDYTAQSAMTYNELIRESDKAVVRGRANWHKHLEGLKSGS